jgi:hypothetical protein
MKCKTWAACGRPVVVLPRGSSKPFFRATVIIARARADAPEPEARGTGVGVYIDF